MYVAGFVIPVPEDKMDDYRAWAEMSATIFKDYGCVEIVEAWEDNVPDGKETDFRKAVKAEPGEKIVFTWQVWPDKETLTNAERAMHDDPRMEPQMEVPFAARRIIYGAFDPIFVMGRKES